MADVSSFIRLGWQNIWKQKVIWLFSSLSIFPQLIKLYIDKTEPNFSLSPVYILMAFIYVMLWLVSFIGVPYIAYRYTSGKPATIRETFVAVSKFSGRVVGFSCLVLLLYFPFIVLVLALSYNGTAKPPRFSNFADLGFLLLAVFGSFWDFSLFGFFANNWSIRKSIKNAWFLFTSHLVVLAILGIYLNLVLRACITTSGILTILLQNGLDVESLGKLNVINPSTTLGNNMLFVVINGISNMINQTFSASVFVLAYRKYNGEKIPSFLTMQR